MLTSASYARAVLFPLGLSLIIVGSAACGYQTQAGPAATKAASKDRSTEPVVAGPARQQASADGGGGGEGVTLTAVRRVWGMPLFQQARQACGKHQYSQAIQLLEHLEQKPGLTPGERAFCKQQEAICDAHLHPAARAAAVKPMPAAPPAIDCGPRSLLLACRALHVPATLEALTAAARMTKTGATFSGLKRAAESVGLKAEGVQAGRTALPDVPTPALAWVHGDHYIAVLSLHGRGEQGTAVVHDPNEPAAKTIAQERLLQMSGGYLLTLRK